MDLLSTLLGSMTSSEAVDTLAEKSGGSPDQVSSLVSAALPLLVGSMTNNASSQSGASSLLSALSQHTSTAPVEEQIKEADEEDGGKIIGHILGNNTAKVTDTLSKDTGLSSAQVKKILFTLAPAILSVLYSTTKKASSSKKSTKKATAGIDLSDGIDAKDILGAASLLMAAQSASKKSSKKQQTDPTAALIGSLLGGGQSSGTANLLGSLLGSGSSKNTSSVDGTALLGSLLSLVSTDNS